MGWAFQLFVRSSVLILKIAGTLFVINRIGVTGRYPHNIEKVFEQYTKAKTQKIISETKEILTWLMQKSSKR